MDAKLRTACRNDDIETLSEMIHEGLDVNATDENGWAPAHVCAASGSVDCMGLLSEKGANFSARTHDGDTPGDLAEIAGYTELSMDIRDFAANAPRSRMAVAA